MLAAIAVPVFEEELTRTGGGLDVLDAGANANVDVDADAVTVAVAVIVLMIVSVFVWLIGVVDPDVRL